MPISSSELGLAARQIGLALAGLSAGQAISTAAVTVTNAGDDVGLIAVHVADFQCIPIGQSWMTGGLAVGDFNRDSWPDVFVLGGGDSPDKLYMNDGHGAFVDQALAWGVAEPHGGCGAAVADFDNDGWQDIYVTSFGNANQPSQPGQHRLYRNTGRNSFMNVAVQAGVNQTTVDVASGFGSAFGDYDLDGDLDLFVAAWKDNAGAGNGGAGNRLFRNNGDGTFTDVTVLLGNATVGVWGFQPAFVDMNGDLFPELLVAADFGTSRYLVNNNGTLSNFTVPSGTGLDENGMGQTVGDVDNDGLLDWYVTSIHLTRPPLGFNSGNMLYMNQGNHSFDETSVESGVNDGGWGWGTVAVDLDHDGWLDLIEVNGRAAAGGKWNNEPEYLFHNDGDGTFTEIGAAAGLDLAGDARAIALLDADHDGDQDFVISVFNGPLRYYRNDTTSIGAWITINFDTGANPFLPADGYGTRIIATIDGQSQTRYISGSPSYLATSELVAHFGFSAVPIADTIDTIEIHWTRGNVSVLQHVAVNQFLTIEAPIPADVTADGSVNVADLLAVISDWGSCPAPCASDVNNDATVNVADLLLVIGNWG
ncbi:MAG: FG-GAP-like repeat-containing protein [Phycisphaerales bacterium]|nr:FG-GAP-like repeat-containing protein [Phycisphaerales bacterium]MCI0676987.1 FG-GAP-like repeat-containing protein [Phycisphaerales bacterium]